MCIDLIVYGYGFGMSGFVIFLIIGVYFVVMIVGVLLFFVVVWKLLLCWILMGVLVFVGVGFLLFLLFYDVYG